MSEYLHYELNLGPRDVVQVSLSVPAYIRFLTEENYHQYRRGGQYHYHGGMANVSPSNTKPPQPGFWHLVIDLGGKPGNFDATVTIIQEIKPDTKGKKKKRK